ncbi:hypothetical protein C0J52_26681 [Blattella germanica]|nr:hypothetical protein C0J52_26681 [Blattella germanica]
MNPQHCIPVLNDNGFYLSESRAICSYLVDKYAKDDSLYPKDPKKRALVNQRLYFDAGTLYQRFIDYYLTVMWMGQKEDPAKYEKLKEAFKLLDTFLEGKTWVAGDQLTIADFDIVTTVSSAEVFDFNVNEYPNVSKWFANAKKTIPGYEEINNAGCVEYRQYYLNKLNTTMPIDLHYVLISAPCRSVILTAKAAGIELNLKVCNLFAGAHMTPEFLKMNPQHTVPTMDDNGFYLSESRAICSYLVSQYAKQDSLYPKDPKKRALVDQRLYFDAGTLYQRFVDYYGSIMWLGQEPDQAKYQKFQEAVKLLDTFLEGNTWVTGETLTIADIDLVTTISSAEIFGFDLKPYPNVARWFAKAKKTLPGYEEINHAGCVEYKNAPCRSVMLTAKAAGIELNLIECNLFKGEHMKMEFLKMNPQHCVPTLNDNGFCLGESRAICTYLLDQYAKDDSLYPKDPKKRALVDQKLYFDATNIYQRFIDYYVSNIFLCWIFFCS